MIRIDIKSKLQEILLKHIAVTDLDAALLDDLTDFVEDNFEAKQ